jgi:predicted transcriptional regulator
MAGTGEPAATVGGEGRGERRTVIDADGRAKAYRPVPAPERTAAVIAGLEAYESGDFFEAHELMEPAWMGTDDPAERDLIQGLIKLAAADVHEVRGNPRGVARNLEGARDRVRRVSRGDAIPDLEVDLPGLLDAIDRRLARLADHRRTDPIAISWSCR